MAKHKEKTFSHKDAFLAAGIALVFSLVITTSLAGMSLIGLIDMTTVEIMIPLRSGFAAAVHIPVLGPIVAKFR